MKEHPEELRQMSEEARIKSKKYVPKIRSENQIGLWY